MNPSEPWIDPRLEQRLDALRAVPPRDPQASDRGRADFLSKAQALANDQAVSGRRNLRQTGWIEKITTLFDGKERSPMFTAFVSLLIGVALLFGGAGATVYAAQGSLPDQPLYGVKTASEDLRLGTAAGPQARLDLSLEFANRRVEELKAMFQKGEVLPGPALNRYQQQLDGALGLAAGMPAAQMTQALERIRQRLQTQEQAVLQLPSEAEPQAEAVLARTREMIQARLHWVEHGLQDPQAFRRQAGHGWEKAPAEPAGKPGRVPGSGNHESQGPGPNQDPGSGCAGNGECDEHGWLGTGTPAPGSGYGPGPGPDADCLAGDCQGDGPGPHGTGTPAPGSGYGPGPGPDPDCPAGDCQGDGSGPHPTEAAGSGGGSGPGPDPDCHEDGCEGDGPGPNQDPGVGSQDGCGDCSGSNSDPGSGGGAGPEPDSTSPPHDDSGHHPDDGSGGGHHGGGGDR